MALSIEWDEEKAKANLKNHRVSFEEATTVSVTHFQSPFLIQTVRRRSNGISTSATRIEVEYW